MSTEAKTSSFTKSQTKLLAEAKTLFWKHGVSRISVEEICNNAQVSKMTFYRSFDNKYEIAKVLMQQIFDKQFLHYRQIMCQDFSFATKIEHVIQLKLQTTNEMSMEFVRDLYQLKGDNHTLISELTDFSQKFLTEFQTDLKKAQINGEIRTDIKVEFIIHMMNIIQKEMQNDQLINMYKDASQLTRELTSFFFQGILNHDKSE